MNTNEIRNLNLPEYSEEETLKALHKNVDAALDRQNRIFEETNIDIYDQLFITVNGIQHAFLLGGPQVQGICEFIKNVCEENGYAIPCGPEDAYDAQTIIEAVMQPKPTSNYEKVKAYVIANIPSAYIHASINWNWVECIETKEEAEALIAFIRENKMEDRGIYPDAETKYFGIRFR